jgi:hypothetical protein
MVYWIVVLGIWLVSVLLVLLGGIFAVKYLQTSSTLALVGTVVSFTLGLLLNFLVVNWPTGSAPAVVKKGLDEKTLEALKVMAKTVTIAPKAVKEGLEKIIEKYSAQQS